MNASVDSTLERIGFGRFQLITLILSGIASTAVAAEAIAPFIVVPLIKAEWHLSKAAALQVPSLMLLGQIIGGFVWSFSADRFGRKPVFLASSLLMFVFGSGMAAAASFSQFCITYFLMCFANTGVGRVHLIYFIECTSMKNRKIKTSLIFCFFAIGTIYAAALSITNMGWRSYLILSAVPSALLLLFCLFWQYETPEYLAAKGRYFEASTVLKQMARMNGLDNLKTDIDNAEESVPAVSLFTNIKRFWKPLLLSSVFFFCYFSTTTALHVSTEFFLRSRSLSTGFFDVFVGLSQFAGFALTAMSLHYGRFQNELIAGAFLCVSSASAVSIFIKSEKILIVLFSIIWILVSYVLNVIAVHVSEKFPVTCRLRLLQLMFLSGLLASFIPSALLLVIWGKWPFSVNVSVSGFSALGAFSAYWLLNHI